MVKRKVVQIAITAMLLMSLSFTTTAVFAYWREITLEDVVVITATSEKGELILTNLTGSFEGQLVPEGRAVFVGEVEEVILTYTIGVSKDLINEMNLTISAVDVLIGGEDTYSHLVDIEILGSKDRITISMYNDLITISVRVRLIEPIDQQEAIDLGLDLDLVNVEDSRAAFNAIAGQDITFGLHFRLTKRD